MDKRPDFGKDLATLSDDVTAEVGDVLLALRQNRTTGRKVVAIKGGSVGNEQQAATADTPSVESSDEVPSSDRSRGPRTTARPSAKQVLDEHVALENVTARLCRETNELLTEAALRQRLKKEAPATRQDIVEEALQDWFRKRGYAR